MTPLLFPLADLLDGLPLVEGRIDPMWRQERSRSSDGRAWIKDLGPMLWKASYQTAAMPNEDALVLETRIAAMRGGIELFHGWDIRRKAPASDTVSLLSGVSVHAINPARTALRLAGLPIGFEISFGDYLSVNDGTNLYLMRATGSAAADGVGITPEFTVIPEIQPALAPGQPVVLRLAPGLFRIDQDSLSSQPKGLRHSTVSWTGTQVIL